MHSPTDSISKVHQRRPPNTKKIVQIIKSRSQNSSFFSKPGALDGGWAGGLRQKHASRGAEKILPRAKTNRTPWVEWAAARLGEGFVRGAERRRGGRGGLEAGGHTRSLHSVRKHYQLAETAWRPTAQPFLLK